MDKALLIGHPEQLEDVKQYLLGLGWKEGEIRMLKNPTTRDMADFYDGSRGKRYLHCVGGSGTNNLRERT